MVVNNDYVTLLVPNLIRFQAKKKHSTDYLVKPRAVLPLLIFLKLHVNCLFESLIDIVGVDYPERMNRFEIIMHLVSVKFNSRINVKTFSNEITALTTLIYLYYSAAWAERETWDMYGIPFSYNVDLRRILTDYGFEGHPLRKDFPLTGFTEQRYDDTFKHIVYELLENSQEFRYFPDLSNDWL